jgi:PPOX class probable F420-dependent enzyme
MKAVAMIELTEDVRALLDGPNYAHVATVLPDGSPHSVPVWIGLEGDRIVFLTGPDSRKARNIAQDPRVAISITDAANPFAMASIRGRVVDRLDGESAWSIIDRLSQEYLGVSYSRGEQRVVFVVEPEHAVAMEIG